MSMEGKRVVAAHVPFTMIPLMIVSALIATWFFEVPQGSAFRFAFGASIGSFITYYVWGDRP